MRIGCGLGHRLVMCGGMRIGGMGISFFGGGLFFSRGLLAGLGLFWLGLLGRFGCGRRGIVACLGFRSFGLGRISAVGIGFRGRGLGGRCMRVSACTMVVVRCVGSDCKAAGQRKREQGDVIDVHDGCPLR
jgi:hypothetical protein